MSTHKQDRKTAVPTFPPAQRVGQHLVIDRAEWVPGENPETHLRHDGQTAYTERYFRCLRCGEERLSKRDFPEECPG
jgi:hypothetical protein